VLVYLMKANGEMFKAEYTLPAEEFIDQIADKVIKKLLHLKPEEKLKTEDRYLTVEELAQYMGYSKQWIYNNYKRKGIPHEKPGRKLLFKLSEIDKWIETNRGKGQRRDQVPAFRQQGVTSV
jgi:excisionase family DNA binding protein